MFSIKIEVDVQNPVEVVKSQKGKFAAFAANFFMSREKLKDKVEGVIADEMAKAIKENIQKEMKANGVNAYINISVNKQ